MATPARWPFTFPAAPRLLGTPDVSGHEGTESVTTPRVAPCEVCRAMTDRRVTFERRPRRVFLCSDACEQVFRMRLKLIREDESTPPAGAS